MNDALDPKKVAEVKRLYQSYKTLEKGDRERLKTIAAELAEEVRGFDPFSNDSQRNEELSKLLGFLGPNDEKPQK
ncbi:MAG: hypothetical protein AB8E15_02510 [Bdellovibrionales bacterium]